MGKKYDKTKMTFTKPVYDIFLKEAFLTDDELFVLNKRLLGWSVHDIAEEMKYCDNTIKNRIKSIRKKYDAVQQHRKELPVRTSSEIEEWMDNPDSRGKYDGLVSVIDPDDMIYKTDK